MKGKARKGGGHGPGLGPAMKKNPNETPNVNDAPEGPHAHFLGHTGDGGMSGSEKVSSKGQTFHFK
jgi:hypothetical protein